MKGNDKVIAKLNFLLADELDRDQPVHGASRDVRQLGL